MGSFSTNSEGVKNRLRNPIITALGGARSSPGLWLRAVRLSSQPARDAFHDLSVHDESTHRFLGTDASDTLRE